MSESKEFKIEHFKKNLTHQLPNANSNAAINGSQGMNGPNNGACSTVFHVGLGQYVQDQEHFKNLFTV